MVVMELPLSDSRGEEGEDEGGQSRCDQGGVATGGDGAAPCLSARGGEEEVSAEAGRKGQGEEEGSREKRKGTVTPMSGCYESTVQPYKLPPAS